MAVSAVLWQAQLKLQHRQSQIAQDNQSAGTLKPLIMKHGGDVKGALLELANKVETTARGEVVELSFDYTGITDEDLAHLSQFPDLRVLSLSGTKINGSGLVHLKRLENLDTLSMYYTSIDDSGLRYLEECRHLRVLILVATSVTGEGMKSLTDLPNLETLVLELAPFSDGQIEDLKQLKQLSTLDLIGTKFTEEGIAELRSSLPNCAIYGP